MSRLEHALASVALRILGLVFDRLPIRRRVVLATARVARLEGNLAYLDAEIRRTRPGVELVTLLEPYSYGLLGKLAYLARLVRGTYLLRTSSLFVVDNAYLPVHVAPHRARTTVVQVWHAVGALKRFGADTTTGLAEPERSFLHRHYDYVVCAGEESRRPYAAALRTPVERVLPLGVARTDMFFDPGALAAARERVLAAYPALRGGRVVLYAPTFRGRGRAKRAAPGFDPVRGPGGPAAGSRARPEVASQPGPGALCRDSRLRRRHRPGARDQRGLRGDGRPGHRLLVVDLRVGTAPAAARAAHRRTWRRTSAIPGCTSTPGRSSSASTWTELDDLPRAIAEARVDAAAWQAFVERRIGACDGARERALRRAVPAGMTGSGCDGRSRGDRTSRSSPRCTTSSRTCPTSSTRSSGSGSRPGDLEVVAVDDGSTDGSLDLLREWGGRSRHRVRIYTKPNGGQGSARNLGLEHATGEWVTFTDPDDMLDRDYFAVADTVRARRIRRSTILAHPADPAARRRAAAPEDTHPRRRQYEAGDRVVDLDEEPNVFPGSASVTLFRLDRIASRAACASTSASGRTSRTGTSPCATCSGSRRRASASWRRARYVYRQAIRGHSTLQRSLERPGPLHATSSSSATSTSSTGA